MPLIRRQIVVLIPTLQSMVRRNKLAEIRFFLPSLLAAGAIKPLR